MGNYGIKYHNLIYFMLQHNIMLRSLNLSMNGFSTRGTMAMAEAIKRNSTLQELDMSYNRIYDDSAVKLAKALYKNESLRKLNVSYH